MDTLPRNFGVIYRTMHHVRVLVKKTSEKIAQSPNIANPSITTRTVIIEAGTVSQPDIVQPSAGINSVEEFNSETQRHSTTAVTACSKPECPKQICNDLAKEECGLYNSCYNANSVTEHGGNLTHNPPKGLASVRLSDTDFKGNLNNPQFLIKETATVPIQRETLKINQTATNYASSEFIAPQIVHNLPDTSVLKINASTSSNELPNPKTGHEIL